MLARTQNSGSLVSSAFKYESNRRSAIHGCMSAAEKKRAESLNNANFMELPQPLTFHKLPILNLTKASITLIASHHHDSPLAHFSFYIVK